MVTEDMLWTKGGLSMGKARHHSTTHTQLNFAQGFEEDTIQSWRLADEGSIIKLFLHYSQRLKFKRDLAKLHK